MLRSIKNNGNLEGLSKEDLVYMYTTMYTNKIDKKIAFSQLPIESAYYPIIYTMDTALKLTNQSGSFYAMLRRYKGFEQDVIIMQEIVIASKLNIIPKELIINLLKTCTNGNVINLAIRILATKIRMNINTGENLEEYAHKFRLKHSAFPYINSIACNFGINCDYEVLKVSSSWTMSQEVLLVQLRYMLEFTACDRRGIIAGIYGFASSNINKYPVLAILTESIRKEFKNLQSYSQDEWFTIQLELEKFIDYYVSLSRLLNKSLDNSAELEDMQSAFRDKILNLNDAINRNIHNDSTIHEIKKLSLFD